MIVLTRQAVASLLLASTTSDKGIGFQITLFMWDGNTNPCPDFSGSLAKAQ